MLLNHVKWACELAEGLQQARRKASPSAMRLEGLPDSVTALEESAEKERGSITHFISSSGQNPSFDGVVSNCVLQQGKITYELLG